MIALLVFYVHIVAAAAVFTKRWQHGGMVEGALGVLFMALIFFVGWSITSFVMKLFMTQEGLAPWFDRDAASLLLLTAVEGVFYYFFLKEERSTGARTSPQSRV
jgi:hypothetical protein